MTLRMFCSFCGAGLLTLTTGAPAAPAAPAYRYVDLGPASSTRNVRIDDSGRVAWNFVDGDGAGIRVWKKGETTVLPRVAGARRVALRDISRAGVVARWSGDDFSTSYAWLNGPTITLKNFENVDTDIAPMPAAIGDDGVIVGYAMHKRTGEENTLIPRAAHWEGSRPVSLEIDNEYAPSGASAMSSRGHIVGRSGDEDGLTQLQLWTVSGQLGTPETPVEWSAISPAGINDHDHVVGMITRDHRTVGVAWDGSSWRELDLLGRTSAVVEAINNDDLIVGQIDDERAVLWDLHGGAYDLNQIVERPEGVYLNKALDINDRGWIVGLAHEPGSPEPRRIFAAIPIPAPGSLGVLAWIGLGCARRRR